METTNAEKESLLNQRLSRIRSILYEAQDLNRRIDCQICVIGGNYPKDNVNIDTKIKETTSESVLDKLDFNLAQLDVLIVELKTNVNMLADLTGA